ncbi:molybdenum cofactor sulfurase isoform X4 [Pezoporus flaviventris]|uniref:molybdenum cofactor sulfurase isoform X4 n=1 Tax=Pezoporus flaviventris TaxID=889875 RepID=UPI002AB2925E|nr:molybdenum cofactor sulfurase isoform X4 [Pezoporus flaviventris]
MTGPGPALGPSRQSTPYPPPACSGAATGPAAPGAQRSLSGSSTALCRRARGRAGRRSTGNPAGAGGGRSEAGRAGSDRAVRGRPQCLPAELPAGRLRAQQSRAGALVRLSLPLFSPAALSMAGAPLGDLLSFRAFRAACPAGYEYGYGYGGGLPGLREREFPRLRGITYLDHAGSALFPESLLKAFTDDLRNNVYGNPHSQNISSKLTHDTIEHVRYRILQHFHTTPEDYTVIFTSGCTTALKLVAEAFPWIPGGTKQPSSRFCYLTDSHTSVVGIRGITGSMNVSSVPIKPKEILLSEKNRLSAEEQNCTTPHLFSYPAQSNFSGTKYPLSWIQDIKSGKLCPIKIPGKWFVLLDAASYVSSSPLDLEVHQADFIPISFYKIFGFPTGLGALLVNNRIAPLLRKTYFGGGTAAAYLAGEDFYFPRKSIAERFEDGTVSFLDIIALKHGFDVLEKLTGGMEKIKQHTFALAHYTYNVLSTLKYANGAPVVRIYSDTDFSNPDVQGPIINFNILDENGEVIGFSQVTEWPVGNQGLLYDRNWMVVNQNGVCITQKQEPRLCLINPSIDLKKKIMVIQAEGMDPISVSLEENTGKETVISESKVCSHRVKTYDCGERIAVWFSMILARPCRLIRQSSDMSHQKNTKGLASATNISLSLVNEAQYLLINVASILQLKEHISARLEEPLEMEELIRRFRANIVISAPESFEEEEWAEISIGALRFQVVGPCSRCQIICIDQQSGERNKEFMQSLSVARGRKTNFGIYLMNQPLHSSLPDMLSVGSQVLPVLKENMEIQPPTSSEEKCSG